MDEKTEELREIFMDVAGGDTVTERQEESRGSLSTDEARDDDYLESVVRSMRERYDFSTELSDSALVTVVRGFYEGAGDSDIADDLGVDRRVVFRARTDLQLVRDRDRDAPFDLDELRALLDEGLAVTEIADELDVSESTVRRYRRVVEAQRNIQRTGERYLEEFRDAFVDLDLGASMTDDMKEDGLEDATEGMETNTSF
ncbi:helix-turn-helix domain-containing protein [Natronomonas sp. EA1]|uniref:helix-turn-helix domain-containing protein n=1 Tax=Natronomonas sp. EA1 TaxID=3421655 RepID=UPI003EB8D5BD